MSLADQLTDEQIAEAREVFNFYSKGPVLAVANCAVALRTCAANPSAGEIQVRSVFAASEITPSSGHMIMP